MALNIFRKKKKDENEQVDDILQDDVVSKPKKKRGKKKRDGMSSVLHESVMGTVLDDFHENTPFVLEVDGHTKYLGLYLDTEDIGGLNKKSNKDEAKGSIIECINSGRIKTLITADLLEAEDIIIVPDSITLDAMEEFSLLARAPYRICFVDDDENIELTENSISWQEAMQIQTNQESLKRFLGLEEEEVEEEPYEEELYEEEIEDIPYEDDSSPADEVPDDYSSGEDTMFEEGFDFNDEEDYSDYDEPTDESDDTEDDFSEEPEVDPYEIPDELVHGTITRKFYSDDLGLEITTEPFDAQFLHHNGYVPFNESFEDGWLNEYVSHLTKDANTELKKMHQHNLFKVRERYLKLVAMHCEDIQRSLDTNDDNTQFGQISSSLKKRRLNTLSDIDKIVAKKRNEIETDWENKIKQVGEDAATMARKQFRDRFGSQHEQNLYQIEPNVKNEVEQDYHIAVYQMQEDRRAEASKRLDYGINETLQEVSEMYVDMLDAEQFRYNELQAQIAAFVDDNRKDDVAQRKALEEDHKRRREAEEVRSELTSKLESKASEYEANRISLQVEIEDMERKNEQKIQENNMICENKINEYKNRNEELQDRVNDLLTKYSDLDAQKKMEYESRINQLINERATWEDKCNHIVEVHKRSNSISGFLAIAAIIATLAIGFIAGSFIQINNDSVTQQAEIVNEFNNSIDSLDTYTE